VTPWTAASPPLHDAFLVDRPGRRSRGFPSGDWIGCVPSSAACSELLSGLCLVADQALLGVACPVRRWLRFGARVSLSTGRGSVLVLRLGASGNNSSDSLLPLAPPSRVHPDQRTQGTALSSGHWPCAAGCRLPASAYSVQSSVRAPPKLSFAVRLSQTLAPALIQTLLNSRDHVNSRDQAQHRSLRKGGLTHGRWKLERDVQCRLRRRP
jgi:hypothetical protein